MRALVCEAYGPIENLKIADVPVPEPKAGEVLLRVGAAGVSFAAMLGVQGKHQNKPPLPYVPGNEMAGHIVKLGAGVTNLSVGQRVATGVSQGAFAEYAVATAANVVPIPETMPYAAGDQFPDALSDGVRRLEMEGRHAAGRGAAGAWRGRRLGPDRDRGRQGDGRRRHCLGRRRRQARRRAGSRRRPSDRLSLAKTCAAACWS